MWTNAYGATSSSTTIAARGSRRRFRPLTESPHVVNTNSSPSSANHTGITCGCPLGPLVASLAVRVPWLRKARISSEVIARGMCSPVCRYGPGRRRPSVPFVHAFQHPTCSAVAESEGTHVFEEGVDGSSPSEGFSMPGRLAAVDVECLPRDERGPLQVEDPVDDVANLSHPTERVNGGRAVVRCGVVHRRLDHSERDRIDADAAFRIFDRQRASDRVQPAFGQRSESRGDRADRVVDETRRHVDDMTGALVSDLR